MVTGSLSHLCPQATCYTANGAPGFCRSELNALNVLGNEWDVGLFVKYALGDHSVVPTEDLVRVPSPTTD